MYQKRSGWILSAVAPNRGPATSLQAVMLAVQTEIPLRKQHLSDQLIAIKGEGVTGHRDDRFSGERRELTRAPVVEPEQRHECDGGEFGQGAQRSRPFRPSSRRARAARPATRR